MHRRVIEMLIRAIIDNDLTEISLLQTTILFFSTSSKVHASLISSEPHLDRSIDRPPTVELQSLKQEVLKTRIPQVSTESRSALRIKINKFISKVWK